MHRRTHHKPCSASVVTDSTGAVVGEQRYYPYGETRFTTGTIYTDKLFTGQREMAGLGIYDYGARFYSPKLGRFLSADTIVQSYANPQNLNRFSYVRNNPVRYTDPTGHMIPCEPGDVCRHPDPTPPPPCNCQPPPDPDPNPGCVGCSLPAPYQNTNYYQLLASSLYTIPSLDTPEWCDITGTDCVLSAVGFFSSAFTFAPPPIDLIATVVDVVVTVWSIGRTEEDYSQGKISNTRRWILNGTGVVGLAPAWLGPQSGLIGAGASLFNLLVTATGIPN